MAYQNTHQNKPRNTHQSTHRSALLKPSKPLKTSKSRGSRNSRSPRPAKRRPKKPNVATRTANTAKKVVLVVIGLAAVAVLAISIFALNFNPNSPDAIQDDIAHLAHDYYESYFYPNAFGNDRAAATAFLSRFAASGLTSVPLRQLLASTPGVSDSEKARLRQYCDENTTTVQYFPEAPYQVTSYRAELRYTCNFN